MAKGSLHFQISWFGSTVLTQLTNGGQTDSLELQYRLGLHHTVMIAQLFVRK